MEKFKVEHFEKAHPGEKFPWYETLSDSELLKVREVLTEKLSLDKSCDPIHLVQCVSSIGIVLENVNALNCSISLTQIFHSEGIRTNETVLVNWYQFDDIDRIRIKDFDKYFNDLWYPSADDIEIFDNTLSWMLSISHSGVVKLIRSM